MELTGLCGQGFRLTLELGQRYSRQLGWEPIVLVLAEPIMPAEQRGQPSEIRVLFDPFELNVTERSLKKADNVIPLGGRAFDILLALVDRAGEVVSKDELIAKAWPDVTVEEGSLRVHLSMLRKALADGEFGRRYIENVKGRGYCFVAPRHAPGGKRPQGQLICAVVKSAARTQPYGWPGRYYSRDSKPP
jgi:DNA-binding winged helix-turn-helix (wHTH) protein